MPHKDKNNLALGFFVLEQQETKDLLASLNIIMTVQER